MARLLDFLGFLRMSSRRTASPPAQPPCVAVVAMRTTAAVPVRTLLPVSLLIMCLLGAAGSAAQLPSYAMHTESAELSGHNVQVDVYVPVADAHDGVAIIAHGFTRSRAQHRDVGEALAAAGITAVIPDLPNVLDLWGNGEAIAELAHMLEAGALGLQPMERSRVVLIGTSAGGLATVLAAAELPGLAGWVGLDPVDRTGSGIRAASRLTAPAIVLLGEPSQCNLFGSGASIARAVPGLLRATFVPGAAHCDFEGPTNMLCRVICGPSSSSMQARLRDETVDAAVEILHGVHGGQASGPADPPD